MYYMCNESRNNSILCNKRQLILYAKENIHKIIKYYFGKCRCGFTNFNYIKYYKIHQTLQSNAELKLLMPN